METITKVNEVECIESRESWGFGEQTAPAAPDIETALALIGARKKAGLTLVTSGAVPVNAVGALKFTPLLCACYALWPEGVDALLLAGGDREYRTANFSAARAALMGALDRVEAGGGVSLERRASLRCARILQRLHRDDA